MEWKADSGIRLWEDPGSVTGGLDSPHGTGTGSLILCAHNRAGALARDYNYMLKSKKQPVQETTPGTPRSLWEAWSSEGRRHFQRSHSFSPRPEALLTPDTRGPRDGWLEDPHITLPDPPTALLLTPVWQHRALQRYDRVAEFGNVQYELPRRIVQTSV